MFVLPQIIKNLPKVSNLRKVMAIYSDVHCTDRNVYATFNLYKPSEGSRPSEGSKPGNLEKSYSNTPISRLENHRQECLCYH